MECDNGHKFVFVKLAPLQGDTEESYLVTLNYQKPSNIFEWPLYLLRNIGGNSVKVYSGEVEGITWRQESDSLWTLKVSRFRVFPGLADVENWHELKEYCYKKSHKST